MSSTATAGGSAAAASSRWPGPTGSTRRPPRRGCRSGSATGPGTLGCRLEPVPPDRWRLTLDEADPGVAPGQHAVLYDGEVCLGGAVIC